MEEICKEKICVSMFSSISLTQAHDHNKHHFSNIFKFKFQEAFSGLYLGVNKIMWDWGFCKKMPFINFGKMILFHTFHVLQMLLI